MYACAILKLFARAKKCLHVSRLRRNEKLRFIPRGVSVWNLKICLISLRWQTSFLASPDFSTVTRTSSSEWPGLLKCCTFLVKNVEVVFPETVRQSVPSSFGMAVYRDSLQGEHRFIFTMNIKSLYTVTPNDKALRALKYFLDKREVLDPPTHTLLHMAELAFTLNSFVFNGEHYKQIGGVAMGSKLSLNYACLFVGFVEEKMLRDYTGIKPDLYKRYMDDVVGAASYTEDDLTQFLIFASSYHPKLQYTWSISSVKLPFLDMFLIPCDDRIATSIQYKETDSHSYLNFKSSHTFKCKASIPTNQFLRLRRICSEDDDFEEAATTILRCARLCHPTCTRGKTQGLTECQWLLPIIPRTRLSKILSRNYNILTDDSTRVTFSQPLLKAYRRAKNLRDLLVDSDFPPDQPARQPGTFPCRQTICRTCPHINQSTSIPSPEGQITITGHFHVHFRKHHLLHFLL